MAFSFSRLALSIAKSFSFFADSISALFLILAVSRVRSLSLLIRAISSSFASRILSTSCFASSFALATAVLASSSSGWICFNSSLRATRSSLRLDDSCRSFEVKNRNPKNAAAGRTTAATDDNTASLRLRAARFLPFSRFCRTSTTGWSD